MKHDALKLLGMEYGYKVFVEYYNWSLKNSSVLKSLCNFAFEDKLKLHHCGKSWFEIPLLSELCVF